MLYHPLGWIVIPPKDYHRNHFNGTTTATGFSRVLSYVRKMSGILKIIFYADFSPEDVTSQLFFIQVLTRN